jgi:uncharacterized protein (DUF983 family)
VAEEKERNMGRTKIGTCPRCKKGELFIDRDFYGWYENCLQCGYARDLPELAHPVRGEVIEEKEKTPKVKVKSLTARRGA